MNVQLQGLLDVLKTRGSGWVVAGSCPMYLLRRRVAEVLIDEEGSDIDVFIHNDMCNGRPFESFVGEVVLEWNAKAKRLARHTCPTYQVDDTIVQFVDATKSADAVRDRQTRGVLAIHPVVGVMDTFDLSCCQVGIVHLSDAQCAAYRDGAMGELGAEYTDAGGYRRVHCFGGVRDPACAYVHGADVACPGMCANDVRVFPCDDVSLRALPHRPRRAGFYFVARMSTLRDLRGFEVAAPGFPRGTCLVSIARTNSGDRPGRSPLYRRVKYSDRGFFVVSERKSADMEMLLQHRAETYPVAADTLKDVYEDPFAVTLPGFQVLCRKLGLLDNVSTWMMLKRLAENVLSGPLHDQPTEDDTYADSRRPV